MYLVAGLGNPGLKYRKTRHNLGFMVLDSLARSWNVRLKRAGDLYKMVVCKYPSRDVILVKPVTYMNHSGIAVKKIADDWQIPSRRILIICDDLNLPLGRIRLREKGSDGGQKGLGSIIAALGTDQFTRMRLGIGGNTGMDAARYVLSRFYSNEKECVRGMIRTAREAVVYLLREGIVPAMNRYNN